MSHERIGLFGGTFDPPHLAHLILASEAAYQLRLARILWVLNPAPLHKPGQVIASLHHRQAMLEKMIADNPLFEFSRLEMDRPAPYYTVDTVRLLAAQEPDAEIVLLIGGDSLHDLPAWRAPSDLIAAVHQIGVLRRPGDSVNLSRLEAALPGLTDKVRFVDAFLQDVSSRDIRRRLANDEPYRYYLLPSVYEYIVKHNLYRQSKIVNPKS